MRRKRQISSRIVYSCGMEPEQTANPIDRLDALLHRFSVRAERLHTGPFQGSRHYHARHGQGYVHVLRAGTLRVSDGERGTTRTISEPSLLLYPRPHEHRFDATGNDGVLLACATLHVDGGAAHPLMAALPAVLTVPIRELSGLDEVLSLLDAESADPRCGHRHVLDRLFEIVLFKLLRHLVDRPERVGLPGGLLAGLADPALARALVAMHERPGEPWSLDALGRVARMSRSSFAARFRGVVGVTPYEYLLDWRVTVGQQRLRQGVAVTQVAAELGYSGGSFSRVFVQRRGLTPRAWAEAARAREG